MHEADTGGTLDTFLSHTLVTMILLPAKPLDPTSVFIQVNLLLETKQVFEVISYNLERKNKQTKNNRDEQLKILIQNWTRLYLQSKIV